MPAVKVSNLYFSYEGAKSDAVTNVSFELKNGSYTVLAGKNGSGKSTVAKIIAGLLAQKKGTVQIEENLRAGIIFQSPKDQIICGIVFQDTEFGPQNLGFSKAEVELNTIESLSATGMISFANHKTMNLSLGQTQKVALSGILAMDPDILILDEALSMLDPNSREEMYNFIDSINNKGVTVLHISHDFESVLRARDVIFMENGKIKWQGTSKEFSENKNLVETLTGKKLIKPEKKWNSEGKEISLCARNIDFSYNKKNHVLKKISFDLYKGSLTALVGPSGCGKSTLLEILSGLLKTNSGEIFCTERPVLAQQNSDSALFENFAADDVAFGPKNKGLHGKNLKERVKNSMNLCNLDFEKFANRQTFCLSGGEKKRLAVAGIVALDADILLFDEPTAALDGESREKVLMLMKNLSLQGKTVMFSTHQRDEADFADRVINLSAVEKIIESKNDIPKNLNKLEQISALSVLERIQKFSFSEDENKKGIIGKLPAVLKYILFLSLFCTSLVIRPIYLGAIFMCAGLTYALCAKCPAKRLFCSMLKIIPLLLFFCAFQMIFVSPQANEIRYVNYRFFTITPSKLLNCLNILIRTESALCIISGFVHSIDESQLIKGFSDMLLPLKLLHIPIKYILVTVEIIFRFIPLLLDEAACIVKTQLVRGGLGKAKGFFGKLKAIIPLIVPLIIQALKRAEALAEALTARGFK